MEEKKTKISEFRDHLELMRDSKFKYGAVIPKDEFCAMFGVELMDEDAFEKRRHTMTLKQVKRMVEGNSLEVLDLVGKINNELLPLGRWLVQDGDNVRVLLPSENESKANQMKRSAHSKLKRAEALVRNTPKEAHVIDMTKPY